MSENLISVIVPVYKVEKYLDRCVESIVNQSYKNLEIILVDDGSPDNCPKMCDEWAKKDSRIKVIHKENGGLSDARNKGIDIATGEYIMFVDSDDFVSVKICERLLGLLQEYDAMLAVSDFEPFNEGGIIEESLTKETTIKILNREQIAGQIYNPTIGSIITAWAKLYKKELFNEVRYPIGKLHEDEYVFHEIMYLTERLVYIPEKLYYYLQRGTSITGNKKEKNVVDAMEAFENRLMFLNEKFSECINENNLLFLKNLRRLYCYNSWVSKPLKKQMLSRYRQIFNCTYCKSLKERLFYHLPEFVAKFLKQKRRIINENK